MSMSKIKSFLRKCAAFRDETRGSLSVEAVFAFPLLLWATTATYTFFDVYKAQNGTYRANYTISDMLSRETAIIDDAYMTGLFKVFRYMTKADQNDSWIRVSVVECISDCSQPNRELSWNWSNGVNGARNLGSSDLEFYDTIIPLFPVGDRLILVETSMDYKPPFSLALTSFAERPLVSHVVTRPRFAPQLCFNDSCDDNYVYDGDSE